ncbi:hypothetical protein [Amycolatopsis aidingensis]|uniref:hypothetical protein n=1 Tax=Amycolatopsis aidingensis TaxID=2842453 RepID=UPI001C0BA220|nr:hypothetical protein [Amycolatopsis aidingensis]
MRDTVQFHVTADLPIRARAMPFADRAEIRFGKAFPVALLVDHDALPGLMQAIQDVRNELDQAAARKNEE